MDHQATVTGSYPSVNIAVSTFAENKFWEVIVSVILRKKMYMYMCLIPVSDIVLFHCTVPKLLMRKRFYVLFLVTVFVVQVTKLVQFT
jgi:hypothetical protein